MTEQLPCSCWIDEHFYPDFQRTADLWKPIAKSRLIKSLLIRLPAFHFDATDDDK